MQSSLKFATLAEVGSCVTAYCRISRIGDRPSFWYLKGRTADSPYDTTLIVQKSLTYEDKQWIPSLYSTLHFEGIVQLAPQGETREINVQRILFYGPFDASEVEIAYNMKPELLRQKESQRLLTKRYQMIMFLSQCTERYLHEVSEEANLMKVRAPFITFSDCEGGGEVFRVQSDIQGFFKKPAYLTVSGQVDEETVTARFMCPTYIFGPSFRSDPSQTNWRACEFWHYEPEVPFITLDGLIDLEERTIKGLIKKLLSDPDAVAAFRFLERDLEPLQKFVDEPFARVTYTEAIKILQSSGMVFDKDPKWGEDLTKEHERYLCETHFKRPTACTSYPSAIKSFYMMQQQPFVDAEISSEPLQTVAGVDLLVPGIGELCGGSLREYRYDLLLQQLQQRGLHVEDYNEYLSLRRQGTLPHGGYGMGFDRLVMFLTGVKSIRDVCPFPRYYENAELQDSAVVSQSS
eukprot:TRINITY_DN4086_c0_g1_i1.p1 TRINITY_DN4086_c0_g1~~TRINITY_DN4086_c0_g1_i1.p1  ORF type:complete len:462 (+),score=80.12 TRINITY_DN4086_c0_g1_i1:457-1842(+)